MTQISLKDYFGIKVPFESVHEVAKLLTHPRDIFEKTTTTNPRKKKKKIGKIKFHNLKILETSNGYAIWCIRNITKYVKINRFGYPLESTVRKIIVCFHLSWRDQDRTEPVGMKFWKYFMYYEIKSSPIPFVNCPITLLDVTKTINKEWRDNVARYHNGVKIMKQIENLIPKLKNNCYEKIVIGFVNPIEFDKDTPLFSSGIFRQKASVPCEQLAFDQVIEVLLGDEKSIQVPYQNISSIKIEDGIVETSVENLINGNFSLDID